MVKTGRVIDYSKWDRMQFSSDEDESSDHEHPGVVQPQVTRLDEPSKITTTVDGSFLVQRGVSSKSITNSDVCESNENFHNEGKKGIEKPGIDSSDAGEIPQKRHDIFAFDKHKIRLLTKNGGTYIDSKTKINSYWSQDRHQVVLSVAFDGNAILSRDIRVEVTGALHYRNRYSAVGSGGMQKNKSIGLDGKKGYLTVWYNGEENSKKILLEGELSYFIYLAEDEEEVEWEIDVTNPRTKLVKIMLNKALPMQNLTIWWSRPLMKFPEINVQTDIEGRFGANECSGNSGSGINEQEKMKTVWDEAHRMFREKVKNRAKLAID